MQRRLLLAAAMCAGLGSAWDAAYGTAGNPNSGVFFWTGTGDNANWSERFNWGGFDYPYGPSATANIIGGPTVLVNFDIPVSNLTLRNATITDSGNPHTLTALDTLTFSGTSGDASSIGSNLTSNGVASWTGGNINTMLSPDIVNHGAFNITCDQSMFSTWFGPAMLHNTGSLTKNATSGLTTMSIELYNSGTITANTGTLSLIGNSNVAGTNSGTFTSNGSGRVQLSYHNFTSGASFTGSGTTELLAGNLVSGAATVRSGATLAITSGVNTINGSINIASGATMYLTGNGGDIDGTGTINGPGTFVFNGGQIRGAAGNGTAFLTSTGPMHITGPDTKTFYDGRFKNTGHMTWDGGEIHTALTPVIANTGTFEIQGDNPMFSVSFGPPLIQNSGLMTKTVGVGTSSLTTDLQNSGTVRASSGYLAITGQTTNSTNSGTFTSNSGGTVVLSGQTLNNGVKFNGTGVNVLHGGNTIAGNVSITAGRTIMTSGVNDLTGTLSIASGATFELTDFGDLRGDGHIVGPGNMEWTGGQIRGATSGGTTSLTSSAPLAISGSNVKTLYDGRYTNAGHATWSGGDIHTALTPVFTNSGVFDITGNNNMFSVFFGPATINNSGTMHKFGAPAGEILAVTSISGEFHNTGTVQADTGLLSIYGTSASLSNSNGTFISNGSGVVGLDHHTFNTGTNFRGTGVTQIGDQNVIAGNVTVATGRTQVMGSNNGLSGTVSIASGATFEIAPGGQVGGTGSIGGAGVFEWTGGNVGWSAFETDELTNTARLRMIGTDPKTLTNSRFRNTGLATWEDGDIQTEFSPVFTNAGTFDIQNDNALYSTFFGPGSIANTGTWKKTGSTGGQTSINAVMNNSGSMLLNVGSTQFGDTFTTTGTFSVAPGANVSFAGDTTLAGVQNWPANYVLQQTVPTHVNTDAGYAGAKLVLKTSNALSIGSSQHLVGFEVNFANATVSAGGNKFISSGTLSIVGSSHLDLNDADMILTATPKSEIETHVYNGYNFGGWDGFGIVSTTALNDPNGNKMFGVMSGDEYFNNNGDDHFDGQLVHATDTLVKYTYFGDVDFNGSVDVSDYNLIDFGFSSHLTGWANGDVDYSGSVDVSDYNLVDFAFSSQNGTLRRAIAYLDGSDRSSRGMNGDPSLQIIAEHFAQFGETYASGFLATVPEPTTILVIAPAMLAMGIRRRRR